MKQAINGIDFEISSGADLRRANLSGADLSGADLSRAYLSSADLRRADLSGANLSSADLSGANLSGADLRGADLSRAYLSGADLRGAEGVGKFDNVGSSGRTLIFYYEHKKLMFSTGCFCGTESEFKQKINETHGNNHYAKLYLLLIKAAREKASEWE